MPTVPGRKCLAFLQHVRRFLLPFGHFFFPPRNFWHPPDVLDTFQRPPASWHFRQLLLTAFCLLWTFNRFPASLAFWAASCLQGTFKRPPVSLVLLAASCLPGTFIRPRPSLALRSSEHFLLLSWHFWQPEVLQEASPTSLALLATS